MSDRLLRINEAMREVLGEAVAQLNDPRLGFVTITSVRIARDLRAAKVYFSVLGDQAARDRTAQALRSSHGVLRRAVGNSVQMRHTPQLEFVYDHSTDIALRIEGLLRDGGAGAAGGS